MNSIFKSIFTAIIVASFSLNASAEDTATKDREAASNEAKASTPGQTQTSEHRKEMREHIKNQTTQEERDAMHQKVTEDMAKKSAKEHEKKASERRKEVREHIKSTTTPEERKEMHMRIKENMDNKSSDPDNSKPASKPAN